MAMPPLNVTAQQKERHAIRKAGVRNRQLRHGVRIVAEAAKIVFGKGEMRLAGIRIQTQRRSDGIVGARETPRRRIEIEKIEKAVGPREIGVGEAKSRVARHCFLKQPNRLFERGRGVGRIQIAVYELITGDI